MSEAALIRAHRLAQTKNGGLAAALMVAIGNELKTGRINNEVFVLEAIAGMKLARDASNRLARQHLLEARALVGIDGPIVEAEFDGGLAYGRATWTATDLAQLRRTEDRAWVQDFQRIIGRLASWADWYAKMAGRDTVVSSAEAAGTGWRRVTDGNPCAFCAMLAGRGPVYASKEAASVAVSRDRRRKRPFGEKYHQHCGCTVVEQHGEWVPTAEEQRYVEAYEAAADAGGTSDVLAHMREHGHFNDSPAPKTQAGGAGGGKRPPRTGAGPFKEMGEPPDPADKDAWKVYWKKRQAALPYDFMGDTIKPHEVLSYERLARAAEALEYVKERRAEPTADFTWVSRGGVLVEMKTVQTPDAKHVYRRIEDAVIKARNHKWAPLDKEFFLVDFDNVALTDSVRAELARYNVGRRKYTIKGLWVMHSDGVIERVPLE